MSVMHCDLRIRGGIRETEIQQTVKASLNESCAQHMSLDLVF
jgi:hypothetical protein